MPSKNHSLELSAEQQSILDSKVRLKVVSACPGAGKTRLFVAALKHYKSLVNRPGAGVAALSFTNVAQDEIAQRLGGWHVPDFVGTIDSFLLRFVLRPFGHLAGVKRDGARLIPATLYGHFNQSIRVGEKATNRANIHDVTFVGEEPTGKLILKAKANFKNQVVHQAAHDGVLKEKRKLWKGLGHVSHSDSHYLCDAILRSAAGPDIVKIIARKFPFILVDELQDTQYFLGQSLLNLFDPPLVEGLAVGDSDQAIYEFGGAHRALFAELASKAGGQAFSLDVSRRCSAAICRSATHLSCRAATITEAEGASVGRCILLVLGNDEPEIAQTLATYIATLSGLQERVTILARKNDTLSLLRGRGEAVAFPGSSRFAAHAHAAVLRLMGGDPSTARRMIETDLGELVFEKRGGVRDELAKAGISLDLWRGANCLILFEAAKVVTGETWSEWQARLKSAFSAALNSLNQGEKAKHLGQKFRADDQLKGLRTLMVSEDCPVEWPSETKFFNVHEMKGLESELVCFYVPKEPKKGASIADEWWVQDSEERKVAFVACSRAIRLLVLAVHQATFEKLTAKRNDFVSTFEVVTLAGG